MNADHDESVRLDEMLARRYEALRAPVAGQREAILEGLSSPRPAAAGPRRQVVRGPLPWMAAAACLAIVTVGLALLVPSHERRVYGVESVPDQLAGVQSIVQRGYRIIYPRHEANGPPVRVPIEYLIKRPDKFRHSWWVVSYPRDAPLIVKQGVRMCDGQSESSISYEDQGCKTAPIGVLDAWIKTEMHAQELLTTLLGPPGVPYKKVGRETIDDRACDVYEGRFGSDDEFISKLWLDPQTGYAVRSTSDEVLPDGSTRRVQELEEIAVNVPLDDSLFELEPPEGFRVVTSPKQVDATTLSSESTSGGYGFNEKLEVWHAFRITPSAALLVWRRSAPKAAADGTSDWLSGVSFGVVGDERQPSVLHDWVYQSRSPDVWNWSLVAVADGELPDRGGVRIEFESDRLDSRNAMIPLQFPEAGLARIIEAAVRSTLPEGAPQFQLEDLRRLARNMTQDDR